MDKPEAIDAALVMPWEKGTKPEASHQGLLDALEDEKAQEASDPGAKKPAPKAEKPEEPEPEEEEAEGEEEEGQEQDGGDDDSDDESEESDEDREDTPSYKIKVDGETIEVTLPELLDGYSRTGAFHNRMREVAEQRKAVEADRLAINADRQKYADRLTALEKALTEALPKEPDRAKLMQDDPTGAKYAVAYADHQREKTKLDEVKAELGRVAQAQADDQAKALESYSREQMGLLLEQVPEWKDEKVLEAERNKLRTRLLSKGYSESDLDGVRDHRLLIELRKAMLYDEIQTNGVQKVREKAKAAPVLKPGGRVTHDPKRTATKAAIKRAERARVSGDLDDVAASIADDL